MKFKNIFKTSNAEESNSINNVSDVPSTKSATQVSNINWRDRGVKAAGESGGQPIAYEANLNAEVGLMKKLQQEDYEKQASWRQKLSDEKIGYEAKIKANENTLEHNQTTIKDKESKKQQLNIKKKELETSSKTNKNALVNFIFGLFILVGITVYLFIFYSSTAYSAFFKQFGLDNTAIVSEMFDSQALPNALNDGVTELFFVLLIPTLFLGLGYVIHQFGAKTHSKSEAKMNMLKIIALYLITFIFDCLLAFKISKSMYEVMAAGSLEELPMYSLSMASGNVDFWTVIFCGFVAYVIWGLVFSFVMNNYESLHKHTAEIRAIEADIDGIETELNKLRQTITDLKNEIADLQAKILKINNALSDSFVISWAEIKTNLAAFHQGWLAFMSLQNMTEGDKAEVNKIYDGFIKAIDNNLQN